MEAERIEAGRIVGRSGIDGGSVVAAEWDVAGRVVWQLPGGTNASAVNANTLIVGKYQTSTDGEQTGVWNNGQFVGLLTKPTGAASISASGISDDGVVFGSYRIDTRTVPARWACG